MYFTLHGATVISGIAFYIRDACFNGAAHLPAVGISLNTLFQHGAFSVRVYLGRIHHLIADTFSVIQGWHGIRRIRDFHFGG
jgi:hypothetical protein